MNSDNILLLPNQLSIENVSEYKDTLIEHLETSSSVVTVDGSELSRVDTAGVQLLVIFVRQVIANDKQVKWQSCSDVLQATAEQLGLKQQLLDCK
ncbi:MAG: hypothetical protein OFPI_36300 [Osedax symbiont Rs2]|nr:MAG: hypothetical protein OFPI_36300 [Osedax symbiont Rs2]